MPFLCQENKFYLFYFFWVAYFPSIAHPKRAVNGGQSALPTLVSYSYEHSYLVLVGVVTTRISALMTLL